MIGSTRNRDPVHMSESSGKPSLARRFAHGLSRIGLDPGPVFQRARNLVLRPARHELGDARREVEALRQELGAQRQELAAQRNELEAQRQQAVAAQQEAAAALQEATTARQEALAARQQDVGVRRQAAEDASRQLLGETSLLRGQLENLHERMEREGNSNALRRLHLLEQLLAGPADVTLPAPAPLVSIVMPTRDRAACLAEAIASVQAQTYANWHLHIVDDGSRDQTRAVVEPLLADPRISYEAIPPSGHAAARNRALRAARGEYIAYLDSDNLWFPGFLAAAVATLAGNPASDLAYGVLATDAHGGDGLQLLHEPFDRTRLERGNYIDLNIIVHRRALYETHGGFDEGLARLVDWDLLLRYTVDAPALAMPVLAARYRVCDRQRISETVPAGPSWLAIRRRVDPVPASAPAPRVLYVIWHYPQLSETYVEGEIRCLRRWGAEVAVWREIGAASPYAAQVPVHDGDLEEVVRAFRPDVVHVHWLSFALGYGDRLAGLGVPVTLRMHGFDVDAAGFRKLLANDWLHRVYAYPHQLRLLEAPDPRVRVVCGAFDTSYFPPAATKDPRLVLRTSACLPSKELSLFFEVAKRLPSHRFVFCGVTCNHLEHYPDELRRMAAEMDSPVELRFDVRREEIAELMGRAGIFLHTILPPEAPQGTPIGMPISIAEAMATGAYVLVRDLPELADYVGRAGDTYRDAAHATELIAATQGWSEAEWLRRRVRASDHAYLNYADELVFRPILDDWQALAMRRKPLAEAKEGARAG